MQVLPKMPEQALRLLSSCVRTALIPPFVFPGRHTDAQTHNTDQAHTHTLSIPHACNGAASASLMSSARAGPHVPSGTRTSRCHRPLVPKRAEQTVEAQRAMGQGPLLLLRSSTLGREGCGVREREREGESARERDRDREDRKGQTDTHLPLLTCPHSRATTTANAHLQQRLWRRRSHFPLRPLATKNTDLQWTHTHTHTYTYTHCLLQSPFCCFQSLFVGYICAFSLSLSLSLSFFFLSHS